MKLNKKGFTMTELLIVAIIIAGIASIVYPSYKDALERARASEAVSMLSAIQAAQAKHFVNYETYGTSFRDIRDFSPAVENFDMDQAQFFTEYFRYNMYASSATATRVGADHGDVAAGYSLSANYTTNFVECIPSTGNDYGENVCSSLTDRSKVGNAYRIF